MSKSSKMPSVTAAQLQRAALQEQEAQNRRAGLYEAEEIFNHLVAQIAAFEQSLPEEYEVGMRLANFGEAAQIHIRSISFKNPYLIEFHGLNMDQDVITLIQHVSELNFMLTATKPIDDEPYRIGFDIDRDDEEEEGGLIELDETGEGE